MEVRVVLIWTLRSGSWHRLGFQVIACFFFFSQLSVRTKQNGAYRLSFMVFGTAVPSIVQQLFLFFWLQMTFGIFLSLLKASN